MKRIKKFINFINESQSIGSINANIVIGDSLVPYIASAAGISQGPKAKDIKNSGKNGLWFGGINSKMLLKYAKEYTKVDPSIYTVTITIGTNDIFARNTETIKQLMDRLKIIFPNADFLVVKGAYGSNLKSYPSLQGVSQSTVDSFYSDFTSNGATVIPTPVGNVPDAHGHLPVYKIIGKEIQKMLGEFTVSLSCSSRGGFYDDSEGTCYVDPKEIENLANSGNQRAKKWISCNSMGGVFDNKSGVCYLEPEEIKKLSDKGNDNAKKWLDNQNYIGL